MNIQEGDQGVTDSTPVGDMSTPQPPPPPQPAADTAVSALTSAADTAASALASAAKPLQAATSTSSAIEPDPDETSSQEVPSYSEPEDLNPLELYTSYE